VLFRGLEYKKVVSKKSPGNPYISWTCEVYLPQHCLYFLFDPHEVAFPILSILFIFIILFVFIVFQMKESSILFILSVLFYIINISLLWTRRGLCPHPFT